MTNQHGTSVLQVQNYDELRFHQLTQYTEGNTAHYYGLPGMVPLTEKQARQLRRDGVAGEFGATRPLTAVEDGE